MEVVRDRLGITDRILARDIKCISECNVIVPDVNPDILKILHVDATCSILKKSLANGRLSFEGKIFADVIYLADCDDGGAKTLPAVFEFNDIIDTAEIKDNMLVRLSCDIDRLDINMINSRKISLKAICVVSAELYENKEIEYISSVNSSDAAYKCNDVKMYRIIANDESEFLVKEQHDMGLSGNFEILKCDAAIRDKEVRIAGSKVIVKGTVSVTMLYCDENKAIRNTDARYPFTEVFEVQGIDETDTIDASLSIIEKSACKGISGTAENYVNIEALVRVELMVRREEQICCVTDCYCFGAETNCKRDKIKTERMISLPVSVKSIREVIPEDTHMPSIATVYNVVAKPRVVSTEKNDSSVTINSILDVCVLYLSDNQEMPICCRRAEVPVIHSFDVREAGELMIGAECQQISYSLTGAGDVEIRAVVEFDITNRIENNVNLISEIERGEKTGTNQLIIFFAKGGESLWDVAKEYKTDPSVLSELNCIDETNPIEKGKKLIIPAM